MKNRISSALICLLILATQAGCHPFDDIHFALPATAALAPTPEPTSQPTPGATFAATPLPTAVPPTEIPTAVPTLAATPIVPNPPPTVMPSPTPALHAFVSGLNRTTVEVIVGPRNTLQDLASSPTIEFFVSTNLPARVSAISSASNGFQVTANDGINGYVTRIRGFWFASAGTTDEERWITVVLSDGAQSTVAMVSTKVSSHYPATRPVYLSTSPISGDALYSLSFAEGPAARYTPQAKNWAFQLYAAPVVTAQMQADAAVHRCHWANAPAYHFVNVDHCAGHVDEGILGYAVRVGPLPLSVNLPGGSFFRVYRVYWPSGPRAVTDYDGWYRIAEHPEWGALDDIDYGVMVLN